jgi:hypothetical protein
MRNDPNRARYYRARADRIEAENTLKQQELISKEMVATNLQGFCKAIEGKMRASKLGPEYESRVTAPSKHLGALRSYGIL